MSGDTKQFLGMECLDTAGDLPGVAAPAFGRAVEAVAPPDLATVPISIADLLPDASREVVLSAAEGLTIVLSTRETPVDTGVSDHHLTASGMDVSGFGYYSFSDGLVVYFPHHSLVTLSLEEIV